MKKDYLFKAMKLTIVLLLIAVFHVNAATNAQTVTLKGNAIPFSEVLQAIRTQTGYGVFTSERLLVGTHDVNIDVRDMPLMDFLHLVLRDQPLEAKVENRTIVLSGKPQRINQQQRDTVNRARQAAMIQGRVVDEANQPIAGVTIEVKIGQRMIPGVGTATNTEGLFTLRAPNEPFSLVFSSLGFESQEIPVTGQRELSVVMKQADQALEDIVVTGIFTRERESFTGSAAVYSQQELKRVGGTNIIQSLKTLDPAFAVLDNVQFGSDPNRLPNMEIRGKSSMLGLRDELDVDPNQPLFILDGFESTLAAINDLDINRIESITILKDAASTAIYGSKAANGVVVVETVKPKAGKLQVSYNGNLNISAPDLTSYNLMNASEKLEFEYLAGTYNPLIVETPERTQTDLRLTQMYHNRLKAIAEGIDTYWLAEPLNIGANQKHSLYVMGGEGNFMFGLGGGYNGITGVMKESKRNVINGNIDLIYRTDKFQFTNKFSATNTQFSNPIVPFREYALANPYYRKTNSDGIVEQWLEYNDNLQVSNPLWNASLNSRDEGANLGFS